MRAWIEISLFENKASWNNVALFMRAWIEMFNFALVLHNTSVALFMRAWIEIEGVDLISPIPSRRPLHEGVD